MALSRSSRDAHTCIDVVDVRICSTCEREYVHLDNVDGRIPVRLEPFAAPASLVEWGWRISDARRWVVHCRPVGATGYAFPEHRCSSKHSKHSNDNNEGTVQVTEQWQDPFDVPEKRPAISFKDAPVGATVTCSVVAAPRQVQSRDYTTGLPETWEDGNPKWNVVIDVVVGGEDRSLWAKKMRKDGSLFAAIAKAQKEAGQTIAPGGTLVVKYIGDEPSDNPKHSPRRLFEASYTPGNAVFDDPWAAPPPSAEPVAAGQPAPWD